MSKLVLLDNTVLTNFALINQTDLVLALWANACTTSAAQTEYRAGVRVRGLPIAAWDALPIVELTSVETAFSDSLNKRLGAGERACIAVARYQNGLFVSDDYDARRQAKMYGIPTAGTVGILLLNVRQERVTLTAGNDLLSQLIELGYRSPVAHLNSFF